MATRIEDAETALAAPGSNIESWTVDDLKKSDILVFREDSTQYVDSIIAPNGFQVGLLDEAFLADLLVTGDINGSGRVFAELGFSGSLTKLIDGSDYLIGGTGITLTTNSNGSILIESTGGAGGLGARIKVVEEQTVNAGDPYTINGLFFADYNYDFNLIDIYNNGELLKSGSIQEVGSGDADYYLNSDSINGGEIVFGFNITNVDTVTAIADGGSGGGGSSYTAGQGLNLNGTQFSANIDNTSIIFNENNELALGELQGSLTEGNGINNFLFDGTQNTQISVKPLAGSPITVGVGGVGLDIDNRTAIAISPTDEILISDGNIIGKTSINDIVNLIQTNVDGAPVDASYLVISNTGDLTNERALVMGNGLFANDFGANGAYEVTVAVQNNSGLQFISGKLAIKVADFAGFGLKDDGTNKLSVDVIQFAGTGLKVDTDGQSLAVNFGQTAGTVAPGNNLVTINAGDGINGGGDFLLGEPNPTINLEVNAAQLAGDGLIAVDNNLTLDPDAIVTPDTEISITTGPGLTGDNIFTLGDPNIEWDLNLDISGSGGIKTYASGNTIIIDGSDVQGQTEVFWGDGLNYTDGTASVDFGSGSLQVPDASNTLELQTGFGIAGGDTFNIGQSSIIKLDIDALGTNGITVSTGSNGEMVIDGQTLIDYIQNYYNFNNGLSENNGIVDVNAIGTGGITVSFNNGQLVIDGSSINAGGDYIFDEGFDQNQNEIDLDWGNGATQVPRGSNTLTIDTEIGLKGGDVFTLGDSKVINLSVDAAGAGGISVYADLNGKLIIDGSGISGGGRSYTFSDGLTETNGNVIVDFGSNAGQVARGDKTLTVNTTPGLTGDDIFLIGEDNTLNLGLDISGSNGIQTHVSGNTLIIDGESFLTEYIGTGGIVVTHQSGSVIIDGSNISGSGGVVYTHTNGVFETNGVVEVDFGTGPNQVASGDNTLDINTGIGLLGSGSYLLGQSNQVNLDLDIRGENGIDITTDGNTIVLSGQNTLSAGEGIDITNDIVNIEYQGLNNLIEKAVDGTNITLDENADRLLILDHNTQTVKKIAPSQLPGQEEALKTTVIKDSAGTVQGIITALDTNETLTLKAGANVQLNVTPQDEIVISATALSGSGGDTYWLNPAPDNLTTTSSVGIMGNYGDAVLPSDISPDAYFYVSGSSDQKAVFGGDTRIEGELVSKFGVNIGENANLEAGYIEGITENTRVSDLLTQMNQLLDAMAPPPAKVLENINHLEGIGQEAKLSFGISQPILGVQYHTNIGFSSQIDINGLFVDDLINNSNERIGCFGISTPFIAGQLAADVEENEMHNGLLNYPSGSFQKSNEGLLILELNGAIIHQIDLSQTTGQGIPGFGTANYLNANGSGFINVSEIDYPKFHSGLNSMKHCHRTGYWKVDQSEWRKGHNYLRVAHYFDNQYHLTNFIEWIYMDNTLPIQVRNNQLINYTFTGSKFVSGIEYYTSGSFSYNCLVDNLYNYVYPAYADTISFNTINSDTVSIDIDGQLVNDWKTNVPDILPTETEVKSIEVTGNIQLNADNWLVNEGVEIGINVKHPLKAELDNAYSLNTHSMLMWFPNYISNGVEENFGDEEYRLNDLILYTNQNQILNNAWDSTLDLTNTGNLIVVDGKLVTPSNTDTNGNFRNLLDGGVITYSPSNNPDYTYNTGSMTYLRKFENNTSFTMFNLTITFEGEGNLVPASVLRDNLNFHAYIKLPYSQSTNGQTGWLDLGTNFVTNRYADGYGALRYKLQSLLPCENKYTLGTNGCGISDSVIIKVITNDNWEGHISSIKVKWDTKYHGINI